MANGDNNNPFLNNPFLDYLESSPEGQFGIFQSIAQPFATERRKRETCKIYEILC